MMAGWQVPQPDRRRRVFAVEMRLLGVACWTRRCLPTSTLCASARSDSGLARALRSEQRFQRPRGDEGVVLRAQIARAKAEPRAEFQLLLPPEFRGPGLACLDLRFDTLSLTVPTKDSPGSRARPSRPSHVHGRATARYGAAVQDMPLKYSIA